MSKYSDERKMLAENTLLMMQPISEGVDEVESVESGGSQSKGGTEIMAPSESFYSESKTVLVYPFIRNIIVADDLLINLEVLKNQLSENGVLDRCTFCTNGQESIDVAKRMFEQQIKQNDSSKLATPVSLMLLDF